MIVKNKEILEGLYPDKEVTIRGWVQYSRSHGKLHFLNIRDGTGVIQVTAHSDHLGHDQYQKISNLGQESSVIVKGLVSQDDRAPGGYEIRISDVIEVQRVNDYPLAKLRKKKPDKEILRNLRHLWIRDNRQRAILRIRTGVEDASRKYLKENGFQEAHPPLFSSIACEETSTLFMTNYFGREAILTQSGQLELEAYMYAEGNVFGVDPSFRAEKSRTVRHLAEFWQVEPEMAFADLNDAIKLAENLVSYIVDQVLKNRKHELKILGRDISVLEKITPPFQIISYNQAVEILKSKGYKFEWGDNFGAEHERVISNEFVLPVSVTHYPAKAKAFYMQPAEDPKYVNCFDTFWPNYGEIVGGSERIHDADLLIKKIREYGLNPENYKWYIDLRNYGTVPHSGFGMGIERLTQCICDVDDIMETTLFPRNIRRLSP